MTQVRHFGIAGDGAEVGEARLRSDDLEMSVIGWGAVIRDLRPRHGEMAGRPLVLGLNRLADYEAHSPYFGAIVGRVANRIGGGRAPLDGTTIALSRNLADGNHLHGGVRGFSHRTWRIEDAGPRSVTLSLLSPDGEEGYPGAVAVRARYRLDGPKVVTDITATCEAPTFVNLAQHSYFNLDGGGDARAHLLQIASGRVTATDSHLIPTGEIIAVAGTAHDFSEPRPLVRPGEAAARHDINYCLAGAPRAEPAEAARLTGAKSGLTLRLLTTEPGLQLYDGAHVDVPVPGLDGERYPAHSGLCLEPQRWPDAPNHPHFPTIVLRPGETYRQRTEFHFSW